MSQIWCRQNLHLASLHRASQGQQTAQVAIPRRPTVDTIVGNLASYVRICEEQSAVFRAHTEEFKKEYALYTESADLAKPGQTWKPTLGDRDAYIAENWRGGARSYRGPSPS